jgi:hypothetical protein
MRQKFLVAAVVMALLSACSEKKDDSDIIWDTPYVEFYEESIIVEPEGGEMVIPVLSTGVDNVHIEFQSGDSWEIDPENGDKTPMEGWIKIVKVIEDYDYSTRALPKWDSGISIVVEPNPSGGYERKAWITVQSFSMNDTIEIIQYAGCYGPEE